MKNSGLKYLCEAQCKCGRTRLLTAPNGRIIELCPHEPPVYVNPDGTKEKIEINSVSEVLGYTQLTE